MKLLKKNLNHQKLLSLGIALKSSYNASFCDAVVIENLKSNPSNVQKLKLRGSENTNITKYDRILVHSHRLLHRCLSSQKNNFNLSL